MDISRIFTRKNIAISVAAVVPVIFLFALLVKRTVNVPYWDEWELVPIIQHIHTGQFIWSDFWHQHNEHRILFPRILLIAAAIITHWNTRVESFINLSAAIGSFVLVIKMLYRRLSIESILCAALVVLLLSMVWFSPVQVENWLWGWQIEWFLDIFGVIVSVYAVSRVKHSDITIVNLILLMIGAVLAQYSLGGGTLVWPILIAALIYLGVPKIKVAIVTAAAAIFTGLYYWHYVSPGDTTPLSVTLHEPVAFIKYYFSYLGRPLSFIPWLAPVLGVVLVSLFLSICAYLLIRQRQRVAENVHWIVMGLYAMLAAAATDSARLGFGVRQALDSRYTTISSLLLVSAIIIYFNNRDLISAWLEERKFVLVTRSVFTVVFMLVIVNMAWGVVSADSHGRYLADIQHCTHQSQPSDICLLSAYPNKEIVWSRITYLKEIHWAGY